MRWFQAGSGEFRSGQIDYAAAVGVLIGAKVKGVGVFISLLSR